MLKFIKSVIFYIKVYKQRFKALLEMPLESLRGLRTYSLMFIALYCGYQLWASGSIVIGEFAFKFEKMPIGFLYISFVYCLVNIGKRLTKQNDEQKRFF